MAILEKQHHGTESTWTGERNSRKDLVIGAALTAVSLAAAAALGILASNYSSDLRRHGGGRPPGLAPVIDKTPVEK